MVVEYTAMTKIERIPSIIFLGLMTILGLVLGRTRVALTLVHREPLRAIETLGDRAPEIRDAVRSSYHNYGNTSFEYLPEIVMDTIKSSLIPPQAEHGPIKTAMLSFSDHGNEKNLDSLKLLAIVQHELRKQFGESPSELSIQQVRRSLGISSASASIARNELMRRFLDSDTIRPETPTRSVLQLLSESWGVAQFLHRRTLLEDIRSTSPDLIAQIRSDLLKTRKLFAPSEFTKQDVINDLLDQEVDKILVKRFKI